MNSTFSRRTALSATAATMLSATFSSPLLAQGTPAARGHPAIPAPQLVPVAQILAQLSPAVEVGDGPTGSRRIIPIIGGTVTGPRLNGRILPGGADFQLIRHDNLTQIQARYIVETPAGARIYIENNGLRRASPEVSDRLRRGEAVDPALVYFRTTPHFETAAADFAWMERSIFVSAGARFPDYVQFSVYEVL